VELLLLMMLAIPSIRRMCHFILSNRDYTRFDFARYRSQSLRRGLKRVAQTVLYPFVRDDFTPDVTVRAQLRTIETAQLIALRKEAEDRRPFDHFVAF
jgi:hypothetical protein